MKFKELVRMVFVNIWSHKGRAFLTTLGIIVGVATILLVVAVGRGGEEAVEKQFARLNAGTIYVMPARGESYQISFSSSDVNAIVEKSSFVNIATIMLNAKTEAVYGGTSFKGDVIGVYPEALPLNNLKLTEGRFISDEDDRQRNMVVVLGAEMAEELFGTEPAEGKMIKLDRRNFQVVGILERQGGSAMAGISIDEGAMVPYIVAQRYLIGPNAMPRIIALANDIESVPFAIKEITEILRDKHRIRGQDGFMVRDAGSILGAAQDTARTMSVLLIAVAIIVLVVGGIGIMNVMFISIKERTREIGILKAIGAGEKDILLQFLLEAVFISIAGGLIGVALGTALVPLMQYFDLAVIPSAFGALLGLFFSFVTGTFFGYYPAYKAAKLKTLDALSYE